MTITIDATYEDGVLKPSEPLPLREHETVRVTVEQNRERTVEVEPGDCANEPPRPTLAEKILALAHSLPPGALDNLPDDLAAQHDHYLYGTPKRTE